MSLELVYDYLVSPAFFHGAMLTLLITVTSLVFGILVGLVVALLQEARFRFLRVTLVYLWLFRGTPVLFQIIFIYNVLPGFGIRLSAFVVLSSPCR